MGRCTICSSLIFLILSFSQFSSAYVPSLTANGTPIHWKSSFQWNLIGNPTNQSQIEEADFFDAVVKGLQRWNSASSGAFHFDYWQGTDTNLYPANSEFNGKSSIYFVSHGSSVSQLSPNVLGMTQVWYNVETGEILETDIALNDRAFHFTNNPTDTSGYGAGQGKFTDGKNNVYIQNVVTHELGHSLGLSHSGGLQSTMLFMESPEQAHLDCDEMIAIHALYPTEDSVSRGSLTGRVISESGAPVFGAHVVAISQRRGTVLATTLTNRTGRYFLNALEPGQYFLMVEPFYAGAQALPHYYLNLNATICPSHNLFSRSFLTEGHYGIRLKKITVTAATTSNAPSIVVHCDKSGGASVFLKSALSPSSESLFDIQFENGISGGAGIVDGFHLSSANSYTLKGVTGHLEVHAIGYSLYSPIHPSLSLTDSSGHPIQAQIFDPVYQGESGYMNRDSQLIADHLPLGDYILTVSENHLSASDYPAGPVALDSIPFVVITTSLNQAPPALDPVLPNNARCKDSENFPLYVSPPGIPPQNNIHSGPSISGGGFCSTTQGPSTPKRDVTENHMGPIIGWFFPWILMGFIARLSIRLHGHSRPASL